MEKYDPEAIELKWQKYWEERNLYQVREEPGKAKYYCLEMFPWGGMPLAFLPRTLLFSTVSILPNGLTRISTT